jgi:hypothetical protein
MQPSVFAKVFGHGIGTSMLLGSLMFSAKAGIVVPGIDYLVTPEGGAVYSFILPGGGSFPITFKGLPIGMPNGGAGGYVPPGSIIPGTEGLADTVVNRSASVNTSTPVL